MFQLFYRTYQFAKHIGFIQVRHIENKVNVSTQIQVMKHNYSCLIFNFLTEITYGSHGGTAVVGDKLEGASSGATGIVAYDDNSDIICTCCRNILIWRSNIIKR